VIGISVCEYIKESMWCLRAFRGKRFGLRAMTTGVGVSRAPVAALLFLYSVAVYATDIAGTARIIDGDTLAIGTQVIRLFGIDAPENGQDCKGKHAKRYNCGAAAENALRALLRGRVFCTGTEFDNYQRLIAACSSNDVDINREMVITGHAVAFRQFSEAYIADEDSARISQLGVWSGDFEMPWDFRRKQWESAAQEAPSPDCPIKGNINSKGERIYHTPWSRSYNKTRINTEKSERWFCSEAEALAAGWRAPLR
jgi:endonuclease YncB( thermonuclease family)